MVPSKAARAALMLARPKRALGGTMPYGDSALPIVSDGPPAIGSKPKMLGALPGQPGGGGGGIPGISGGGSGDGNGPGGGEGNGAGGGVGTSAGDAAASASAGVGAGASDAGTGTGTGDSYAAGGKAARAALMLAKRPKRADGGAVDDQLNKLGYRQDNPAVSRGSTDWLKSKQRAAYSDPALLRGAVTGYFKDTVHIPVDMLKDVPGAMGENPVPGTYKYDELMKDVKREGWKPTPILVGINHKGKPHILEGNHRAAVARALGQTHIPGDIRWWNGAEEVDGPWHPKRIAHRLTVADRPKRADGGAVDAPTDLTQQGLYSQPTFARGGSVDKALRLTRADGGPIPPTAPAPGVSVVPDDHPAVAQAKQILNQPTKARVIKDPEYPISSVIARGVPLNPRNPHPTADQVVAARADDRVGGMAVNKRLDTIVPERERVAGGTYTPGAPGGGRWADATIDVGEAVPTGSDPFPIDTSEYRHESRSEKLVDQPGKGFKITDNEIQRLWDESVSESSQAAKNAANAHNVKPTFSAQDWDQAMRLPLRDHLWYELSGEKLAENLPDLTAKQHMKFLDLVGATSARAKPDENLERSLATMSQHMRGVPIDIDLTQPAAVRAALSREGQDTSALPGNKTGHFSDTLALTGGVPTRFPISVNDVWVGKMFGISDDVMSQNQSLHEPMAKYFNKLRDAYNQRMDPLFQYQSWNLQAPAWVDQRGQQSAAESGDAYHQVWGKTLDKLRRAGVEGIVGDKITKQALMDPKFADALRRTTKPFRDAPKATVEFGSTQTPIGKRAHDLYQMALSRGDELSQKEYLSGLTTAMYQSGRGKNHPWERLKKALTGDMGVSGDITRIESPTTKAPLDIGGTFEGAVSPNIRVPLKGMSDRKISHFNGIAGKHLRQDAMAVSTVHDAVPDSEPAENATRGHSIFVPTTEGMDPRHIREFAKEMSTQGHDMSYNRYPNGYRFDVLPKFEDSGPVGVSERQLDDAYEKTLQRHYGTGMIAPHDFKSVYNPASDYAGLRKEALGDIRDEFIQQATAAGLTKGAAARAASAKKPPSDLTGRGKRAWDAYRARLDHLAEAEKGFKELAQRVTDAHVKFVGKAEKRFQKPAPTSDPDAPPFARGGVVDPYKHARRVVSTAGRYSRGGESGKTDERSVVDRALQLTSKGYRK